MSDFPNSIRLSAPVRITDQVWPEGTVPVVSVLCFTYNHVNFIRDAIEGFLMQETTFPLEIVIHDDASTDGTAEIVKEYAEKYPQVFRTILQKKNLFSSGNLPSGGEMAQRYCHGEFIALCEGDDFWISKEKLQKQVEKLEKDATIVGCCHEVLTNHPTSKTGFLFNNYSTLGASQNIGLRHLLSKNCFATCSVLIRSKSLSNLPDSFRSFAMGDWPMWIWATKYGEFFVDPQPMGFYRYHDGGIWSTLSVNKQVLEMIKMLSGISIMIDNKYEDSATEGLIDLFFPIVADAFLNSNYKEFKIAKKYIESSKWDKKLFLKKLSFKILGSKIIDNNIIGLKKIKNCYEIALYIEKSFSMNCVSSNEAKKKLANSVTSRAWMNKLHDPFSTVSLIILSFLISFKGTINTLLKMIQISAGNLRTAAIKR